MKKVFYPLTDPQKSIYFTEEYYNGTNINNICGSLTISQPVNFDKLILAIKQFIRQNEGSRIMISNKHKEVKQYIAEYKDFNIELVDVSSEKELHLLTNKILKKTFQLYDSYLFNFVLFRFPNNSGGFIIKMHHIIADSWAVGIALNEIIEIYSALINNKDFTPKDTNLYSYKNYISAEQEYKLSDKYKKDKDYWNEVFSTIPDVATIPSANSNANLNFSIDASREQFSIPSELLNRINKYCKEQKVSLFNFFTAILSIYIGKVSNLEDFCIATPILNRSNFKEKNTVGMFINMLPIRVRLNNSISFKDLLNSIMTSSTSLLRHQKYCYQNILEDLRKKQNDLKSLYKIMISCQITKINKEQENIPHKTVWHFNKTSPEDIDIHIFDFNDANELNIAYDYNVEKYTSQDMQNMHMRVLHIIEQVLENQNILEKDIEIITEEEKNKILNEFNNTNVDYPKNKTVVQLFEEQVKKNPNKTAIVFEDKKITYKELNEKSNILAKKLLKYGIKSGQTISIRLDRSINMIISIFACIKIGITYVLIEKSLPNERVEYILKDSDSVAMLTNKKLNHNQISKKTIFIDDNEINTYSKVDINSKIIKTNKRLCMIYTSGSTGNPKGVVLRQKGFINLVYAMNHAMNLGICDKFISHASVSFDMFAFELYCSILNGKTLYLTNDIQQKDPISISDIIVQNKIDFMLTTPSKIELLLTNDKLSECLSYIKVFLLGGEVFTSSLYNRMKLKTKGNIYNGYGPTEITACCSIKKVENAENINIGKPVINTQIYILNNQLSLCPIGMIGELCVAGDGLAEGYINNKERTNKSFVNVKSINKKVYRTGDLAKFNDKGEIEYIGRNDFQVKLHGQRIELGEIEKKILNIKSIKNVCVCVKAVQNRDILSAYYIADTNINSKEIKKILQKELPEYMVPTYFLQLDELPLTMNGKIDRKQLPDPILESNKNAKFTKPKNKTEETILKIFKKLLKIEEISTTDNFFELGGDSLLAINLTTYIYENMKVRINIKTVFENPTVKELSNFILSIENKAENTDKIDRIEEKEYYPTSSAQKRIYYASSLDGENSLLYNIAGGIILDKKINTSKLEQCFNKIIDRHESLRTYFEIIDGNIVQKILKKADFKLNVENSNTDNIDELFNNFVKPFNLNTAPLFDAKVINLRNNKTLLFFNTHHIISDGVSISILIDELCKLYNNSNDLPELNISYKDFAVWENNKLKSEKFNKDKEFWVNQFNDEIPLLNMPTNYSRPIVQSFEGDNVYYSIDKGLTIKINELAKKFGITPYMLLLSAYYILLYKYTGQNDIIVGTPIVGRENSQLSNIIGMFVNSLPLRNKIGSSLSFKEFSAGIKETCLNAFEHQTYPFDELINELQIKKDTSRSPLFDTMFIYQSDGNTNITFSGIKAKNYVPKSNISKFDLSLEIIPDNNELNLRFEYCTKLFKKEFIERLSKHYINIIQAILNNNDIKIADINMISEEEKNQILIDFNNTSVAHPKNKTVIQLFEEQAEKNPNSIALVFEGQNMTYKELNEKSNQLAHYLLNNGIKKDEIIAIMVSRSLEMIVGILAILKCGAAYLPIDPEYPEDRILYMLEDSGCNMILLNDNTYHLINNNYTKINISLSANIYINTNTENINTHVSIDSLIYLIYTSGSTGKPKGVLLTHKNILNFILGTKSIIEFNNKKTMVSLTTICFDIFILEVWCSLTSGMKLIIANEEEQNNPYLLNKLCLENNVNMIQTTPSRYTALISDKNNRFYLNNLTEIMIGGEPLSSTLLKNLKKYTKAKIYNMYGPTETAVWSTIKDLSEDNEITVGKPISNTTCYILDKDMNLLPTYVPGELYIGGNGVSNGYNNRKDLTKEKFVYSPFNKNEIIYNTNDLAYFKSNGEIVHLGRTDYQLKINGYRIELSDIEKNILTNNDITNCVVLPISSSEGNKSLYAYLTGTKKIDLKLLKNELLKILPKYMIPNRFIQIDEFPFTPNGKIDRNALKSLNVESIKNIGTSTKYSILTKKIVNIIENKFNIFNIDVNDNLFEIGMDSLSIILLATIISNDFDINLSIKELVECNSIIELSELIQTKSNRTKTNIISKAEKQEYYPVSSAQRRMYYASSLDGDNSLLYNIAGGIILDKKPDINKLKKCFNKIIERHESLRTYFEVIDGNIVQKILKKVDFKLDVENSNTDNIDELFNKFIKPFNLNTAPLFDAKIINLKNNKSLLLFNMHHIISDGASVSILIDELCKLYNNSNDLPELNISYKDFAVWEDNKLKSNEFNKDKEFWVNQFNDEIPLLNMPTNYSRPTTQSFEGSDIYHLIDKDLTKKINELSKKLGITPYMLLLSVYYILLYKYTGQNDIIVGTPIVGRENSQLSNIIGMFVNSLPLRNKIDSSLSFKEFSAIIKENCLNAFEHQTYPFDELIKALEIKRDTSRNPLFDTMFIYQNDGNINVDFAGIKAKNHVPKSNISKFDLSLEIIPENNELNLRFEYCTKLFKKEFIERLSKHYMNIIQAILNNNDIKIADINMISEEEKNQILFDFNNTSVDYPKNKTVIQLFEEQAKKNTNKTAIVFEDKKITYKELNEKANMLGHYLKNVQENSVIGIMLDRSFETIISMLAVLKANCAYMLIDVNLPEDRILYMLENANSPLLITSSNIKDINFKNKLLIDKEDFSNLSKDNLDLKYDINNNLSVVYTSGSTGLPKGVLLQQQGMINLILSYKKFIDIEKFNTFLSICSISFDMFAVEIFIPLLNGKTLILADEEEHKDPLSINKLIKSNNVEFMMITPSKIQLLFTSDDIANCLKCLKSIQLGGESLSSNLFEKLRKYTNAQICNEYGPSEITSCCSYKEIMSADNLNIGRPINNVQIYILNQDMNLCPIGIEGEICVSGDGVSKGYINNPTATNKAFVQNPFGEGMLYKTGDIGKYNSNGELEYIGRKDFQIKMRGLRIELSEIEKQLLNIENIKNCAVVYKEEAENNSYLVGFFTSEKNIDVSYIRTELSKHLPLYMVPKYIIQIKDMPITRNGKVNLKELREYEISSNETSHYVAPENEIQKLFCSTWEKLLNTKVGITDNIFELGADSLLAIKFRVEMLSNNVDVQYADIFKYPTVKELSEVKNITVTEQSDNYDYTKINEVLEKNNVKNYKKAPTNINNNVLLLGSNGFVGMHILYNFIKHDNGNIYCIVRDKNKLSARTRFLDALHFYFGNELDNFVDNRIIILKGDITKENFGLNAQFYNDIVNNVSVVINSSANVKHYGNFKNFENINIGLTQKAIEFCENYKKRLIQISSTSVCGSVNTDKNISFSETNLYIGQKLDNVYIKSKFEAERIVLEHISKGLNAQILRLGNITNRYSDGKFQINPEENAFIGRLQSLIKLGFIPDYLLDSKLQFTPVDLCGYAIILIMQNYIPDFSVFHVYNSNYITMKEFIKLLKKSNIDLKVVSKEKFNEIVKNVLKDDNKKDILSGIINELDLNNDIEINSNIDIISEFSKYFLYTIDFNWLKIDNIYVEKYIKYFKNIKFI